MGSTSPRGWWSWPGGACPRGRSGFIHVGNALGWSPPRRYDFVRTELVYVPAHLRGTYVERLLSHVVAEHGRLIICAYKGPRGVEPLAEELGGWGHAVGGPVEARDADGSLLTRVVWLER